VEKNITPVKEKEVLNDYEATPVPDSEHMSWLSQGAVWIGASFCLAAIQTGGILANGLSFGQSIIAILVGSAILTVLAIFMGIVGAQTHLASAMNSRFSLGIKGSKIFGIVVAFSLFGWFGFQADMFGQTDAQPIKNTECSYMRCHQCSIQQKQSCHQTDKRYPSPVHKYTAIQFIDLAAMQQKFFQHFIY